MSGWNAWAHCRAEAVRAPVWPWIRETLREARGIGECDPQLKHYPPPQVRGRSFCAPRRKDWQLAERAAHFGGKATQPPIFGSGGESGAEALSPRVAQVSAAVEVATSGLRESEIEMHHGDAGEHSNGASTSAGGLRPRVTDDEIARVLTYVECGYSLRRAAAAVGRNHASVLRCIRRDATLASEFRRRRELARSEPMLQLRQASQKSWRAAAWLLQYLDAREGRRRRK